MPAPSERGIPVAVRDAGRRTDAGRRARRGRASREHTASRVEICAPSAVVLACGGFESNPEMRARYLGPGWDLAKVRGTRFNMGSGHQAWRSTIGAAAARPLVGLPCGRLGHQRAALWRPDDRRPVPEAQLSVRHRWSTRRGERYRRRGREFPQPHLCEIRRRDHAAARHVRLAGVRRQGEPLLRDEYRIRAHHQGGGGHAGGAGAEARRRRSGGLPATRCAHTTRACAQRRAVQSEHPSTGCSTQGLAIDKTNWAAALDTPPYHAYGVTTGVTFTFGGVKITNNGRGRGPLRPRRSRACTPPAKWSAGSIITITAAAPA